MAFRAVHAQWGAVFAHLPDLGCGQAWEAVWKVRPSAPLTCDECGHPMHGKVSRNGLRFFAHAPHAPNCALALETLAHHLLKLVLASAARDAGVRAELEVRGPDGTWRADVLASDLGGEWRMALEAQLAPITAADITARTERMRADGVPSIWFTDRPRPPWFGVVPSIRLARSDDSQDLAVAEGLVKHRACTCGGSCGEFYWEDVPATLTDFLGWVFTGRIRSHKCSYEHAVIWSAPRYIAEHEAQVERECGPAPRGPAPRGPAPRGPAPREPGSRDPGRRGPDRREPGRRDPVRRGPDRRGPVRRGPVRRGPDPRDPGRSAVVGSHSMARGYGKGHEGAIRRSATRGMAGYRFG
jgi:hypothetical protein